MSGPFEPTWESLANYEIPSWYKDGKFGIFIHWGVYSVPAFGNEWYPRNMYKQGSKEFEHHVATYGPQKSFGYKDFIPLMTYDRYNPTEYAQLFKEAGAKFVVPVAEHHDGFAMYDSGFSKWCATQMGPKRDVTGELAEAVRAEGLVFGASTHRAEHWWFMDGGREFDSDVNDPAFEDFYGPAQPGPKDHHSLTESPPTEEYLEDWLARTIELVDKYRPQLVWFDWWIRTLPFKPYLQRFAAHYYNRGVEWGLGVAINYKFEAYPDGTAVFDVERGQLAGIRSELWQNDTSVSKNSWGYIDGQDYKTASSIVEDLIDVVSKNGALLLNIGPKADGSIPEPEQQMLRDIGTWLQTNGESIYGTRPWRVFGEGPTEIPEGAFTDTNRAPFTGQDFRFTKSGETLYATALAWPGTKATITSLKGAEVTSVELLGYEGALKFDSTDSSLEIQLPEIATNGYPYVFKIEGKDLTG